MKAQKLPNGNLLVPRRARDSESETLGDGMVEIDQDHPDYSRWLPFISSNKRAEDRDSEDE